MLWRNSSTCKRLHVFAFKMEYEETASGIHVRSLPLLHGKWTLLTFVYNLTELMPNINWLIWYNCINHKKRGYVCRYVEWCITDGSSKAVAVIFWLRKGNDFTKKVFPLVLFCFNWVCTFHRTGHIYWDS